MQNTPCKFFGNISRRNFIGKTALAGGALTFSPFKKFSFSYNNGVELKSALNVKLGIKFISRPIKSPDTNTKICFSYDPDNNLIEFVEELN